jgi:hypothetical protein
VASNGITLLPRLVKIWTVVLELKRGETDMITVICIHFMHVCKECIVTGDCLFLHIIAKVTEIFVLAIQHIFIFHGEEIRAYLHPPVHLGFHLVTVLEMFFTGLRRWKLLGARASLYGG